jgi:hypothetical protein
MHRWCQEHRSQLEEKGSSLEFKLHRLKYINLLVEGNITAALCYANNFVPFSKQNSKGWYSKTIKPQMNYFTNIFVVK